jgi:hypothetical protein
MSNEQQRERAAEYRAFLERPRDYDCISVSLNRVLEVIAEAEARHVRLWLVTRRAALRGLDRKVTVWRWAVLADSEAKAIEVVKESQGAGLLEDEPQFDQFLDGSWTAIAEEEGRVISLPPYPSEPTAAEKEARVKGKKPALRSSRRVLK